MRSWHWRAAVGLALGLSSAACDHAVAPAAVHREPVNAARAAVPAGAPRSASTVDASASGPASVSEADLPAGFAFETIELATGRVLQSARVEQLDVAISPGSVAKVFATSAAVDAGALSLDTKLACPRVVLAEGRRVDCVHPDVGHPLDVVEALAHSCNAFFVSVARRMPRAAFDRALVEAGVSPSDPAAPTVLALLGLDGIRASARQWRRAFVDGIARAQASPGLPAHRALLDGLRRAALDGTASAFGASGLSALAKTGTALLGGGQPGGLVVAVLPAEQPRVAVVAVVAGGAGRDAAELAAERMRLLLGSQRVGGEAAPSSAAPATLGTMATAEAGPSGAGYPSHGGDSEQPNRSPSAASAQLAALPVRVGLWSSGALEVMSMPLEDYVASVVAAEAPAASAPALSRALAVLARSFALAHWGRHASEGYDLCDSTHCQVVGRATPASQAAAAATAARVLGSSTDVARAYYSAACGGTIAAPWSVWHGHDARAEGGLDGPDPVPHDHEQWSGELSKAQIEGVLRSMGLQGAGLRSIDARELSRAGRLTAIHVEGFTPNIVDAEQFRIQVGRRLGWHLIKSSNYTIASTARGARFQGRGKGHGVGFCVAGAAALAKASAPYTTLLSTYFPGLKIVSLIGGPTDGGLAAESATGPGEDTLDVVVPRSHEPDRVALERRIRRLLPTLRARLGRVQRLSLRLRFHPTRGSFGRATGQPWWIGAAQRVSGTTRVVDLIPLDVLERRGDFENVVTHELVHALTADVLDGRPLWIQEGVARHFAGEEVGREGGDTEALPAARVGECPPDAVFTDAKTPADLATAYRRAALCVRDALSRGSDWRDLGIPARTAS